MNSSNRTIPSGNAEVLFVLLLVSKTKSAVSWFKVLVNSSIVSASQACKYLAMNYTKINTTLPTCTMSVVKFLYSFAEFIVSSDT